MPPKIICRKGGCMNKYINVTRIKKENIHNTKTELRAYLGGKIT
jgi:hypothetical protein